MKQSKQNCLKIDNQLELIPINLDYTLEIHKHFTVDIIEFLPIENLSQNVEDTIQFIECSIEQRNKGTDLVWVILKNNHFVGCCGIHTIQSKKPHFGIWIKKQQQDKGIGKKVVQFTLNWGIANLDVLYIKYPVDIRNKPSINLIKNLNLKLSDNYEIGDNKKLKIKEYRFYKT